MPTMYIPTTFGLEVYINTCYFGGVDSCFGFVPSSGQDLSAQSWSTLYQSHTLSDNILIPLSNPTAQKDDYICPKFFYSLHSVHAVTCIQHFCQCNYHCMVHGYSTTKKT